jgi:hypothetical protein
VSSASWHHKARRGGIRSYLVSLRGKRMSMQERGKLGGRPRALTIENLKERRKFAPDPHETRGLLPQPHPSTEPTTKQYQLLGRK